MILPSGTSCAKLCLFKHTLFTILSTIDAQNRINITHSATEELQVRDVKPSLIDTYYRGNLSRVNIGWVKSRDGIQTERQ